MKSHFQAVFLEESVITTFQGTIVIADNEVIFIFMRYSLDEVVDIVGDRYISSRLLCLVAVFNYIMSVNTYPRTSDTYVSTAIFFIDITIFKPTNF